MNKKGFTLVELIVSILVLGIILTMVYRVFFYQEQSLRRQRHWSEMNTVQRKASTYISKELRNIGYCDKTNLMGVTKAFGIIDGQDHSIEYSNDIDGAVMGTVDHEDIHSIGLSGDTLYIDNFFALDNVVSLDFTYVDTTGDTVTSISEVDTLGNWILVAGNEPIAHIKYNLKIALPSLKFSDTVEYSGLATLRNKRP
jgi:prepilin-type N-terminal cleavage/methylation domain-containing protein